MNKMKKFASMAAAILMTACVAVPTTMSLTASAATEVTLAEPKDLPSGTNNITNITAYQIFKGDYTAATTEPSTSTVITEANLSVTGWGDGINADAFITALKADTTIGSSFTSISNSGNTAASAQAVADIVGEWSNNDVKAQAFAKLAVLNKKGSGTTGTFDSSNKKVKFGDDSTNLNDGYYVVTCKLSNTDATTHTAQSLGMLSVLGGSASGLSIGTGTAKVGLPEVMKKVYENEKESETAASIAGYTETDKKWNDVADYCIGDAVPFKLYGTMPQDIGNYSHYYYKFTDTLGTQFDMPEKLTIKVGADTTLTATENSGAWTVTGDNGKNCRVSSNGNEISISFEDIKAYPGVISDTVVTVEYNAKLNNNAEIGLPGQENKVDLTYSNNPNSSYKPDTTDENEDTPDTPGTPGENTGKTPEDKVIVFTYEADFTKVDGVTQKKLEGVEFKLKNADGNYVTLDDAGKVTGWNETGTTIKSASDGTFKIIGLDDGDYTLEETKPLQDYNPIADTTLIINAGTVNNQTWSGTPADALTSFKYKIGNSEMEGTPADGIASGTIENKKGSSLPSTGGIGTTLFYVCGGAMVAVSGIFLITKKRMDKNKD